MSDGERRKCDQCQLLRINGVVAHEIGCPEAWKDSKVKCLWCDQVFVPETRHQCFCDEGCQQAYYG